MKFGKIYRIAVLALTLIPTILGCSVPKFWIQKYREMPDIGDLEEWKANEEVKRTIAEKNSDIEKYYIDQYGRREAQLFEADPIEFCDSATVANKETDSVILAKVNGLPDGVKCTFIHLSDVQLRDEQVRLYDKATSKLADNLIPSFERHPFIETFDGALYYAIIQSINATANSYAKGNPKRPLFMVHTGDAIDAGVITELYEFVYISNELVIPWYNVIGNHDSGTFGNIKPEKIYVKDPFVDFMTMHDNLAFINMHHNADEYSLFTTRTPTNYSHDHTTLTTGEEDRFYSKFNGFDRMSYSHDEIIQLQVCDFCPGYYSIEIMSRNEATGDPAIQMISLNTGYSFGAQGNIDDAQLKWLESEIENCSNKIVLVFGHHNIDTIRNGKKLERIFKRYPSVVAYFCGHKHNHKIKYHPGEGGGFGFWEIITGAIFAYPQQGSIVRVCCEDGVGILDLYAFNHTLRETYTDGEGNIHKSPLYEHAKLAYYGGVKEISPRNKLKIDESLGDRFARLRFPYPRAD